MIPSLKQLASEALKSVQSRRIAEDCDYSMSSIDIVNVIDEIETAHLDAQGRIPVCHDDRNFSQKNLKRKYQEIDGARLESYNEDTHSFQIRVDDSERPEFWCQVTIPMDALQKWLLDQGIVMKYE
jgi:hypothetical protein